MLKFLLAAKDVKKTENNSFVINHKSSPGSRVYKTSDPTTQAIQISLKQLRVYSLFTHHFIMRNIDLRYINI